MSDTERDPRLAAVIELLADYRPLTAQEERDRARMLELARTTSHACSRAQFVPGHFTASAFVVSRDAGRILLIQHPTLGMWLQPGGHIEMDDPSVRSAARREVFEETGLDVDVSDALFDVDIHEIPARGVSPEHLHFDLRFLVVVNGTPEPENQEGVTMRWLSSEDVETFATDASVRRMAGKV